MSIFGLIALVPMTMLLTISFFVLLGVQKTDAKGLKGFGKFVAVLLWLCAAGFLVAGATVVVTGKTPMHMMMMKHGMMQGCTVDKDGKMVCPMMGQTGAVKK